MVAAKEEKQHQQNDESGRFEESDGEQTLVLQHVVPPPGRKFPRCRKTAAATVIE